MTLPKRLDFPLYRGDTLRSRVLKAWIAGGAVVDLTGAQVRAGFRQQDGTVRLFDAEIVQTNGPLSYKHPETGQTVDLGTVNYWSVDIVMAESVTAVLAGNTAAWECDIKLADGTVTTVLYGEIAIGGESIFEADQPWA